MFLPTTVKSVLRKSRNSSRRYIGYLNDFQLSPKEAYIIYRNPLLPKDVVRRFKDIDNGIQGFSSAADTQFIANSLWNESSTPGAIVECGCALGNSTAKLSIVAKHLDKMLYVFDSFEGLPNVYDYHYKYLEDREGLKLMDTSRAGEAGWYPSDLYPGTKMEAKNSNPLANPKPDLPSASRNEYKFKTGSFASDKEQVISNIQEFGEIDHVEFIEGWFEDTMKPKLDELDMPIAAAFVDVDLVLSHEQCFKAIWPRMSDDAYYFSHESQSEIIREFYRDEVGDFRMLFRGRKLNSHLMYFKKHPENLS